VLVSAVKLIITTPPNICCYFMYIIWPVCVCVCVCVCIYIYIFLFYFRDIVNQILLDRVHPYGSLLCQMQYAVIDKINPIITTHQALLAQRHSSVSCITKSSSDTRHRMLSGIDHGICSLSMDDSNNHGTMRKDDANEETLAQAECQAFYRHFQNISIGRFKLAALIYFMYVCVYMVKRTLCTSCSWCDSLLKIKIITKYYTIEVHC
jgi:hypothetical protein